MLPQVSSSAISFIDYDELSQILTIIFVKTGKYTYPNFPKSLYEQFLASSSKGKFYNRHIRDKY